jgi:hypothetical protein
MRISELLTESQNLNELSWDQTKQKLKRAGQIAGDVARGTAKGVGAVAGGIAGMPSAVKQGFKAGKAAVGGAPAGTPAAQAQQADQEPAATPQNQKTSLAPLPGTGNAQPAGGAQAAQQGGRIPKGQAKQEVDAVVKSVQSVRKRDRAAIKQYALQQLSAVQESTKFHSKFLGMDI